MCIASVASASSRRCAFSPVFPALGCPTDRHASKSDVADDVVFPSCTQWTVQVHTADLIRKLDDNTLIRQLGQLTCFCPERGKGLNFSCLLHEATTDTTIASKGCQWKGPRNNILDHISTCPLIVRDAQMLELEESATLTDHELCALDPRGQQPRTGAVVGDDSPLLKTSCAHVLSFLLTMTCSQGCWLRLGHTAR